MNRGKECATPEGFPSGVARARGALRWLWDWSWRLLNDAGRDNLGIVSAGVAFYAFLAIFPGLVVFMSLYGLFTTPLQAEQQLRGVADMLPVAAYQLLLGQMRAIASTSRTALGLGVTGGVILSVWSAAGGTKAIITGLNIAYGRAEPRSLVRMNAVALLITLVGLAAGVMALLLVAIVPAVVSFLNLPTHVGLIIMLTRWLLLTVLIAFGVDLLYRFAPGTRLRGVPKHLGLTPGGILAALFWLFASALFSWYAGHFGNYNKTYGSVGAMVVLLLWLSLTAYSVLLGAELDAELADR